VGDRNEGKEGGRERRAGLARFDRLCAHAGAFRVLTHLLSSSLSPSFPPSLLRWKLPWRLSMTLRHAIMPWPNEPSPCTGPARV